MPNVLSEDINELLTPYKLRKAVLTGSGISGSFDSLSIDAPFVFYHSNKFQMLYIGFDGTGYQTALATSDDLIHWKHKGVVLKRDDNRGWDKVGAAGTWIIKSTNNIYDLPTLKKIGNKYWMAYHSYPLSGYETGPAEIGLAWTEDENLLEWNCLDKPVYSWKNGTDWEKGGLYKACIIEHNNLFYMFYNAKNSDGNWIEQIGVATSYDLIRWKRYDNNPVLKVSDGAWDNMFVSDPCVLNNNDKWFMFYFGFNNKHAQEGLAVSADLFNWDKLDKSIITYGNPGELDEIHAHKPTIIFFNGILYHFYTAVRKYHEGDPTKDLGDEFRCITVATSKILLL